MGEWREREKPEQKPFACLVKSSLMLNPSFPRQWGWVGRDLVLNTGVGKLFNEVSIPSFLPPNVPFVPLLSPQFTITAL